MPDSFQTFITNLRRNWALFVPVAALAVTMVAAVAVARAQIDDHERRLSAVESVTTEQGKLLSAINDRTINIQADVREIRRANP